MKTPAPSPLTACLVLAALVAVFAALPASPLTVVLVAIFVGLLAVELDRSGRHVALRVVLLAAYALPARIRGDFEDEWRDHVLSAGEAGMRPVLAALSIALYAARLAFQHRARLRAAKYVVGLFATHTAVRNATLDSDRWKASKIARFRMVSVIVTALPMVTVLYIVRGRSAARTPTALLVTAGTICWTLCSCTPFVAGLLLMSPSAERFAFLLASLLWLGASQIGTLGAFKEEQSIRVIMRVGGPALQAALDDAGVDRSDWA